MEVRARYILVGLFAFAAIAAGFGFVYWLNNNGGLDERAIYRIRFEGPTSGLQAGAGVQFNGVRVGEVTALQLDPANPRGVLATIAVARGTPLRADTKVGVDFRGLMGSPAVSFAAARRRPPCSLSRDRPRVSRGGCRRFAGPDADRAAGPSAPRQMLGENSESVKSTMDNLKTFSEALGRNSDRVDSIMAGLERMTAGPARKSEAGLRSDRAERFPPR